MSRKFQMPKKVEPKKNQQNYIRCGIVVPEGTSDAVMEEIFNVLRSTQFNKISIPVGTYRYLIDDSIADDDNRVITVGYIKRFDPESNMFDIAIFSNNKQTIEGFENPALELVFKEFNNKLAVITKFNIVSLPDEEDDSAIECDDSCNDNEEIEPVE